MKKFRLLAFLLLSLSVLNPCSGATIVVNRTNDPAGFNLNITVAQLSSEVTPRSTHTAPKRSRSI